MKLKEIFKSPGSLRARDKGLLVSPENNSPEVSKNAAGKIDAQELNYETAIKDSEKEYTDEILRVQEQIDEAVRIGKSPEEIGKLKKYIIALQEGSVKARQNLEEALVNYRRSRREREESNMTAEEESSKHLRY